MDIHFGRNIQLKWQFITTVDEKNFISGNIKLKSSGQPDRNVALFTSEFVIVTYPTYSGRGWTATRAAGTKNINLNVKNAKTEDDGVYTLELQYLSSVGPSSHKYGIRLTILGKFQIFN